MPRLLKKVTTTYIPATSGSAGSPYVPATPPRTVYETNTVCGFSSGVQIIVDEYGVYRLLPATSVYSCVTTSGYKYYPGTAEIPATPYVAPTPAQLTVWKNSGWNSYASAIDALDAGEYFEFTVPTLTRGALIAVDVEGKEGDSVQSFAFGLMVDSNGISVFENGVSTLLQSSRTPTEKLRIYRTPTGGIVYTTQSGALHVSATPTNPSLALSVYGMLYDGYDEVSYSAFVADTITTDLQATLTGTGRLVASANGNAVVMSGTGSLVVNKAFSAAESAMAGSSALLARAEVSGYGVVSLYPVAALGGDYEYGLGSAELPSFTTDGSGGFAIPAALTEGYVQLPYLVSYGIGYDDDVGRSTSTSLPYMSSIGADYEYGFGSVTLPVMRQQSSYGDLYAPDELHLISGAASISRLKVAIDLVMVLDSFGGVVSTFSMTREQVATFLSALTGSAQYSLLGTFAMSMLSTARGITPHTSQIRDQADLHTEGVVWVVNAVNNASAQYEQYGFNSFFTRGGVSYGVANNGIFKLSGGNDSGELIEALLTTGLSDMATRFKKVLPWIYLGVSTTGKVVLKVVTDGETAYYTAHATDEDLNNKRIVTGKGMKGRYWQFTLLNSEGCDFELEGINFRPVITKRSI